MDPLSSRARHTAVQSAPIALVRRYLPGLALCTVVAGGGSGLGALQRAALGAVWLEPLVSAILLGALLRAAWTPPLGFRDGIAFSAKFLLEVAVVLLGASVSAATLAALGLPLVLGIFGLVAAAVLIGFALGRLCGLNARMAVLIACGNAICGNSAIAAAAPVIEADGRDVAAAIAFTAVLGVIVVLALPVLGGALALSGVQYGALAGLTVYAVPQVLAATAPFGSAATQTGTVVKLVRVLMLGPVILALSLLFRGPRGGRRPGLGRLVPWFIVGFLIMVGLNSLHLIPEPALEPFAGASGILTLVSMAALGLQTDIRAVARAGGRAVATIILSLTAILLLSLWLIGLTGL